MGGDELFKTNQGFMHPCRGLTADSKRGVSLANWDLLNGMGVVRDLMRRMKQVLVETMRPTYQKWYTNRKNGCEGENVLYQVTGALGGL